MNLNFTVLDNNYKSINQLLKEQFDISSRLMVKLINNKKILLNGNPVDTRVKPRKGDIVEGLLDLEEDNSNIYPSKMELDIVHEDSYILVIDKPAGVAVHPSMRHYKDSLSNGVRYYFDEIGLKKKIRPVNRLDLNTSGLVIFAKNEYIQEALIKQMKDGTFKKEYICLIVGIFEEKIGTINLPIARKEKSIIERCVSSSGQESITHYEVIAEFENYSLVKCELETGRTHQIRVHMAHIGHPLLGDTLYGKKSGLIDRQALHCSRLSFMHPITKEAVVLESELPEDIISACKFTKF